MVTNTAVTTLPDLELLQHLAVRVPCEACGQFYSVSLRQVLLSQQMLHRGCPAEDSGMVAASGIWISGKLQLSVAGWEGAPSP